MEQDFSENLFQAIDTIIAERIKHLPYDATELVTITDASNAAGGIYKVSPDGWFEELVYSDNPTYQVGDKVYLMRATGSERRFIIGLFMQKDGHSRINRIYTNIQDNFIISENQKDKDFRRLIGKFISQSGLNYSIDEFLALSSTEQNDIINSISENNDDSLGPFIALLLYERLVNSSSGI